MSALTAIEACRQVRSCGGSCRLERLRRSFSFLRPLPREQTRTEAAGNPEIQGAVMPCFAAHFAARMPRHYRVLPRIAALGVKKGGNGRMRDSRTSTVNRHHVMPKDSPYVPAVAEKISACSWSI